MPRNGNLLEKNIYTQLILMTYSIQI